MPSGFIPPVNPWKIAAAYNCVMKGNIDHIFCVYRRIKPAEDVGRTRAMLVNRGQVASFRVLPTFRVGVLCRQPVKNATYWLMRPFPPRLPSISLSTP